MFLLGRVFGGSWVKQWQWRHLEDARDTLRRPDLYDLESRIAFTVGFEVHLGGVRKRGGGGVTARDAIDVGNVSPWKRTKQKNTFFLSR